MSDPQPSIEEWVARQKPGLIEQGRQHGYLRAHLRLLRTEEGGRRKPIATGFRAMWFFGEHTPDGLEVCHDAPILIEGRDVMEPGDEGDVRLHPLFPDLWPRLSPGQRFEFREGGRVLGYADFIESSSPPE